MGLFKRKTNKTNKTNKISKTRNKPVRKEEKTKPKNNTGKTKISIGQTLETNDIYLPYQKNKVPANKTRPVIVVDKIKNPRGEEEFAVVPASSQKNKNTNNLNKKGIKNFRHNLEVVDNENKPIKRNNKFQLNDKCTKLELSDVDKIKDIVINHNKFSSENKRKYNEFQNRYKKKQG